MRIGYSVSGHFNPTLCGVLAGGAGGKDIIVQYSLEHVNVGLPLKKYINGIFDSNTSENSYGFGDIPVDLNIGNNYMNSNKSPILYRMIVEDLDVSGRDAADVVKQDWEYCTGTGQYEGLPTKRPFIDNV